MAVNPVFLNLSKEQLLALTLYGEARGEGTEGMTAVANVIKNRMRNLARFGDISIYQKTGSKLHAIALKSKQFSIYNRTNPSYGKMKYIASNFDENLKNDDTLRKAYNIAKMTLSGYLDDNTKGATHYHAGYVSPGWAGALNKVAQIGDHIFYSAVKIPEYTIYTSAGILILGMLYFNKKG